MEGWIAEMEGYRVQGERIRTGMDRATGPVGAVIAVYDSFGIASGN